MSQSENDSVTKNSDDDMMDYLRNNATFYSKRTFYCPIDKILVPSLYRRFQQRIRDMEVYEDDTWMLSFPRSGATWSLEMIWLLVNNLDYKGAETDLLDRVPFFEHDVYGEENPEVGQSEAPKPKLDIVDALPRPRIIRTHMLPELLPAQLETKKPKIVFVLRNSMDVAISYYHLSCIFYGYTGTEENFFKAMRDGLTLYGCFWHVVARLWELHRQPNVLYFTYEEMKEDLPSVIRKAARFLGKTISDEQVDQLADHLHFSNMRTNKAVNMETLIEEGNFGVSAPDRNFIRKGESGGHKTVMSEETLKEFDKWNCEMKKKLGLCDDKEFPL